MFIEGGMVCALQPGSNIKLCTRQFTHLFRAFTGTYVNTTTIQLHEPETNYSLFLI